MIYDLNWKINQSTVMLVVLYTVTSMYEQYYNNKMLQHINEECIKKEQLYTCVIVIGNNWHLIDSSRLPR